MATYLEQALLAGCVQQGAAIGGMSTAAEDVAQENDWALSVLSETIEEEAAALAAMREERHLEST
jgi:hypothetical protein